MNCKRCGSVGSFCILSEIIPGLVLCEFCQSDIEHLLKTFNKDNAHSPITCQVWEYRNR